jgi:hypothetical protein
MGREERGRLGADTSERWVPHFPSFLFPPAHGKRIAS